MPVHRQAVRKRVGLTVAAEQPCGVQVVGWVGLVASSLQLFTPLATVFVEKVADFAKQQQQPVTLLVD